MAESSNTFNTLSPIYKESYSKKDKKKPKSAFEKIRDKLKKQK
jgi:hypothetical protein